MSDEMQMGQTEVCTDTKPTQNLTNIRLNHGHSTSHHNNQHLHGVLIGSMQGYGNNLIETFKTEALCQIQCMDCQKVPNPFAIKRQNARSSIYLTNPLMNFSILIVKK